MTTIVVKHLPPVLSDSAINEFFEHYGAVEVKAMQGKSRGNVFVSFRDSAGALQAISSLNGLKLLEKTLVAEAVKEGGSSDLAGGIADNNGAEPLAPRQGINYPADPLLEYRYPLPNQLILTNILSSLASVPRFYTQVLHLMNKMNLPPPFTQTVAPSVPVPTAQEALKRKRARGSENIAEEEDEDSEEEEESEDEEEPRKKNKTAAPSAPAPTTPTPQPPAPSSAKKAPPPMQILFKSAPQDAQAKPAAPVPIVPSQQPAALITPSQMIPTVLEPPRNMISLEELQRNKASLDDIKLIDKKYNRGEPSKKLYIKNLAKQVEESDCLFIFNRYFPTDQDAREDLEIKLMKEGKMKGQAFITFPTVEQATKALDEVNGYTLHEKPMVITFSKSA